MFKSAFVPSCSILALFTFLAGFALPVAAAAEARVSEAYGQLPLHFEANRGQAHEDVRFLARGPGYSLYLTAGEAVLVLARSNPDAKRDVHSTPERLSTQARGTPAVLRMSLVGAAPKPPVSGLEELPGKANYFIGKDPAKWRTNVPTYGKVHFREVYPGIDLLYYGNQRQLEYDFVVGPGADPERIVLGFQGAERLEIAAEGELVLHVAGGVIRQQKPIIYQEIDGVRTEIEGRYVLKDANRVGFQVAAYDASQPLVIDPTLEYSTYLGGALNDRSFGIAVDAFDHAYVTGQTLSNNFPTTGAFDTTHNGDSDVFVTKLDPAGSALVYSTYLGGSGSDLGRGIVADANGNAYVIGSAGPGFPTTGGAFQTAFNGGSADAFVTKLDSTGSALLYSTYLGGSGNDPGIGIAVDAAGNAYVTGQTFSGDFPTTLGAFDTSLNGIQDAFVTKLDASGSALVFSTYLGGADDAPATGAEIGCGIGMDVSGVYVAGFTSSTNFPTTLGAFDTTYNGGAGAFGDVFVTKLDPAGSTLVYSTYLGGTSGDSCQGMALDTAGQVYVTGSTSSTNFPTTLGAFDTTFNGGGLDAFVTKLNPTGSALVYSTFLGGTGSDGNSRITVDASGHAYVTGETGSSFDFPITTNAPQPFFGGSLDAFVTKVNPLGSALVYSTYLGGFRFDAGAGIAVDASGSAYVTGRTAGGFPTTPGAFDTTYNGGISDAFVAKIAEVVLSADLSVTKTDSPDPVAVGRDLTYTIAVTNNGPDTATGVTLTDSLPESAAFVSASPECTYNQANHTVTCNLGTLTSGSTATVNIVVRPVQGGTITNMATVTNVTANDPNTANNTATESTKVHGPPNPPEPPACDMVNLPPQAHKPPICP